MKNYVKIISSICIIMICAFATVGCGQTTTKSETTYTQNKTCKQCKEPIPDSNTDGYCDECSVTKSLSKQYNEIHN